MSSPVARTAQAARTAHLSVAGCVAVLALAGHYAGLPGPAAVAALVAAALVGGWGWAWYGRLAGLTAEAGHGVVTASRHRGGILAVVEVTAGTPRTLHCWTTQPPRVGDPVTLYGQPAGGAWAAVTDRTVLLPAVPVPDRSSAPAVTRPGSQHLTGGGTPSGPSNRPDLDAFRNRPSAGPPPL